MAAVCALWRRPRNRGQARHGTPLAMVLGLVLALSACGGPNHAFIESYRTTDDDRVIVVRFTTGPCDGIGEPRIEEGDSVVRVLVEVDVAEADAPCDSIRPKVHELSVHLSAPLSGRQVVSAEGSPPAASLPATPS